MSEIPKLSDKQVDEAFAGITGTFEVDREPSYEERVSRLVDRFEAGTTKHTPEDLQQATHDIGETWYEEGYRRPSSFLDQGGELVLASPHKDNPRVELNKKVEGSQDWRLLVKGEPVDVTVPSEWQGKTAQWRNRSGNISIYQLPDTIEDGQLPENMRLLKDTFGPKLSVLYNPDQATLGTGTVSLRDVEKEFLKRAQKKSDAEYEAAWDEAHKIEGNALQALDKVQRGLLMSAKKHTHLQDLAYREEINRQNSKD